MSRVPMGSDGGPWAMDPETAYDTSFVPQGVERRPDRHHRGLQPHRRRHLRRRVAGPRAAKAIANGAFARSVIPVTDLNGQVVLDHDEFPRAGTTRRVAGRPQAVLRRASARWAASTPWRCRSTTGSRRSTTCTRRATRPASSTARRSCSSAASRSARDHGLTPRARIVVRRRRSAPSRRSCSPARRRRPARRWPRPA